MDPSLSRTNSRCPGNHLLGRGMPGPPTSRAHRRARFALSIARVASRQRLGLGPPAESVSKIEPASRVAIAGDRNQVRTGQGSRIRSDVFSSTAEQRWVVIEIADTQITV